jgi:hypothetical protein
MEDMILGDCLMKGSVRWSASVGGIGVRFRGRREFSGVKISYKVYCTNATFPHIFKVIIRRNAKKAFDRSIACCVELHSLVAPFYYPSLLLYFVSSFF